MDYFINHKKQLPNIKFLNLFLDKFWFIPSDVLQRGIEASIWDRCTFKEPVLSIGIGNGEIDKIIFSNKGQIDTGIDIEPNGLNEAKKTKKYKNVLLQDASKMSFKSNHFNTVVSNSTFEHIEEDLKAVSEVSRVLKKGGLFFLTLPNNFLQDLIIKEERGRVEKLNRFNKRANHIHYRSLNEWEKIFKKNNLKIIFNKYYFKEEIAIYWYRLFKLFTYKIRNKEIWSYIGFSRFLRIFPPFLHKFIWRHLLLSKFRKGFITENKGAMLFIIAQKL